MVPSLFGINNSNRDFSKEDSWGKNQFNNAFPVSLACYMSSKEIKPVYFKLNSELELEKTYIGVDELFGINPLSESAFYSFEGRYTPYEVLTRGTLPGIDLVIKNLSQGMKCVYPIEIKLTTLPDHTTCDLSEELYGSEIVVRPDTIVYQALSISKSLEGDRRGLVEILDEAYKQFKNWNNSNEVAGKFYIIVNALNSIMKKYENIQKPPEVSGQNLQTIYFTSIPATFKKVLKFGQNSTVFI